MKNSTATLEKDRFGLFDGYVSAPIFEAPRNYSSYHDSEIDQQIVVTLPDNTEKTYAHKNT